MFLSALYVSYVTVGSFADVCLFDCFCFYDSVFYVYVCTYGFVYFWLYLNWCICQSLYMNVYVCIHLFVCVSMLVFVSVCDAFLFL